MTIIRSDLTLERPFAISFSYFNFPRIPICQMR